MDPYIRHLPYHLAKGESWQSLFDLIDAGFFLKKKADQFQRYSDLSEDIEQYAISGAIQRQDWFRFIHYAVLAVNLRGLTDALAKEEILQALARNNQHDVAVDISTHLSHPLDRAWSRAVVAADSPPPHTLMGQIGTIVQHLDDTPPLLDEECAQKWSMTLMTILRYGGSECVSHLIPFINRLEPWPDIYDHLWLAVAQSLLDQIGKKEEGRFWEALQKVQDRHRRLKRIPELLKEIDPRHSGPAVRALRSLSGLDKELFWTGFAAMIGTVASDSATAAWSHWNRITQHDGPVPWSPDVICAGRRFLGSLSKAHMNMLLDTLHDPTIRAAMAVVALEENSQQTNHLVAQAAVDAMPAGSERITWSLRLIRAIPATHLSARRKQLMGVARVLCQVKYNVPASDLGRFLDLMALLFPKRLPDHVACVIRVPTTSLETLREIIAASETLGLCELLFKNMSRYAASVARTEKEAFELRQAAMIRLTVTMCLKRKDLAYLREAEAFLLPQELDELYQKISLSMAEEKEFILAHKALKHIRSKSLSLTTCLRILQNPQAMIPPFPSFDRLIRFESLYDAMASTDFIEDERLALTALLERPHSPQNLIEKYLSLIRDRDRQAQAIIDLAQHTLIYQVKRYPHSRRDYQQVTNLLRQAAKLSGEDEALISVTPNLVKLAAKARGVHAVAEYAEAIQRVAALESVPWERRFKTLRILFSQMPAVLFSDPDLNREQMRSRCKATAELFNRWTDMSFEAEFNPAAEGVDNNRHQLLSLLAATVRKMPQQVDDYLQHPFRTRICDDWLPFIAILFGRQRFRSFIEWAEERCLPAGMQNRLKSKWQRIFEADRNDTGVSVQAGVSLSSVREKRRVLDNLERASEVHNLAQAVVQDFRSGGGPAGIQTLKRWLNVHLRTRLGWENTVLLDESERVNRAIRRGQSLLPPKAAGQQDNSDVDRIDHEKRKQLTQIYKKWKYEKRWVWGDSPQESLSQIGFLLGITMFPVLMAFDGVVVSWGNLTEDASLKGLFPAGFKFVLIGLCLTYLINGWMTDRYLAYQTQPDIRIRHWVRCLRFILGGIPLLGLYVSGIWQWLLENPPRWMGMTAMAPESPQAHPLRNRTNRFTCWLLNSGLRLDRFVFWLWWQNFHIWWLVLANIIIASLICNGYLVPRFGADHRGLMVGIAWMLHIYVCSGVLYFFYIQAKEAKATRIGFILRLMLACFWLVPIPLFPLVGILLFILFVAEPEKKQTIIHEAYEKRSAISRLPIWLDFEAILRREWGRARWWKRLRERPDKLDQPQKASEAQKKRYGIYVIECISLLPEATALGWLVARTEKTGSIIASVAGVILPGLLLGASIIGGIGAVAWLICFILSLARTQSPLQVLYQYGYIQFLTLTHLVFLCGLVFGLAFEKQEYHMVWGIFALGGLTGAIVNVGPLILSLILPVHERVITDQPMHSIVPVVWCMLAFVGMGGLHNAQTSAFNILIILSLLKIMPLLNILSIGFAGWLLRPFKIRDMFNRDQPKRVRSAIAFILVTLILPFGSLFIPVWIHINHRIWPEYEAHLPKND